MNADRDPDDCLTADVKWLRALAERVIGDSELAEDACQEAWLAAVRSQTGETAPRRPLLFRVMRRFAWRWRRAESRRDRHEAARSAPASLPSTAELLSRGEQRRLLWRRLTELDEPYRTTLLLRFQEGLDPRAIARRSQSREDTVRWRVRRGLQLLRERYENDSDQNGGLASLAIAALPLASSSKPALANATAMAVRPVALLAGAWTTKKSVIVAGAIVVALLGSAVAWPAVSPPTADTTAERAAEANNVHGNPVARRQQHHHATLNHPSHPAPPETRMPNARTAALMLALIAGSATGQTWGDRTSRKVRGAQAWENAGPDGLPILARNQRLHTWDGSGWQPFTDLPAALPRVADVAFDRARQKLVVLGLTPTFSFTTFEFDATGWVQHAATPGPGTIQIEFDPALGGVLALSTAPSGQTQDYLWTGSTWSPLPANVRPFAVARLIVADMARSKLVAFTPESPGPGGLTYEWDGIAWTQQSPAVAPPRRDVAALTFDEASARVTLFGGSAAGSPLNDMWQWDGSTWSQVSQGTPPTVRSGPLLAFDRRRGGLVLFDRDPASLYDYEWSGNGWQPLPLEPPHARYQIATDLFRNRLVMHGNDSTYEWDGISWTAQQSGGPGRRWSPMAFDVSLARLVVFSGNDFVTQPTPGFTFFSDTWSYDGQQWVSHNPPTAPAARRDHALVSHTASNGVVLFGGIDASGTPRNDTWVWSNGAWTDLTGTLATVPAGGPSRGASGSLTDDPIVLSGNAIWQFDGAWNLINAQLPPLSYRKIAMTTASTPLLIGTDALGTVVNHEFVNGSWVARGPIDADVSSPAIDPLRGNLVMLQGADTYVYTATPATTAEFGAGCGSPAPRLWSEGLPRIGNPSFRVVASGIQGIAGFAADFASAATPLGGGCTSYLTTTFPIGAASPNAFGVASLAAPLPADPTLRGLDLYVQVATLQAGGPLGGVAVSRAMRLRLGD